VWTLVQECRQQALARAVGPKDVLAAAQREAQRRLDEVLSRLPR
jgi:hypothetical protein